MKADKDNFQFQHDGTEEAKQCWKILRGHYNENSGDGLFAWWCNAKGFGSSEPMNCPIVTPSEALTLLQPFDRNNFCVDIEKEKDSPLLDGFKEWFLKGYRKQTDYDYKYWFIDNGGKTRGSVLGDIPIYTLSELSRLMPEIWGDSFYCKTFTVENKTSGTIEPQHTSSEKWEAKIGDKFEFNSCGNIVHAKLIAINNDEAWLKESNGYNHIRDLSQLQPVKTLRDEVLSVIFDWAHKNEKPFDLADRITTLIEQRRG